MPSIQSAKNAYIAKNQMELQQYMQQYNQPINQFMVTQQHQQQQQTLFQYKHAPQTNMSMVSSTTSSKNQHNANTANSKLQSKAIANEITSNKNSANAAEIRRQQNVTANSHNDFSRLLFKSLTLTNSDTFFRKKLVKKLLILPFFKI